MTIKHHLTYRFLPRPRWSSRISLAFCAAFTCTVGAISGQETTAENVVIAADRLPQADVETPFTISELDSDDLRRAPELRLDDILRAEIPGFSLFRRSSSWTANPTTQGVTLRNFGPSGAGRTLVLLDGIPLNDPFAGYVLWSQVPAESIESVIVNPGGGAGLFGNAALAGTIFLVSKPIDETSIGGASAVGNHESYDVSVGGNFVHQPLALSAFAERFSTGGYPVIAPAQRGPVDTNASSTTDVVNTRAEWQIAADSSLRFNARWFDDARDNGTRYTRNGSSGEDISATFTEKFETAELQLSVYGQERKFSSTFSSVNLARTFETPAQDQFDVPASAAGGSAVISLNTGEHRLTFGADARTIDGATNESYAWNGTEFTKLRRAGGDQLFLGAFAEDAWKLSSIATLVGGLRFDHWELFDGFRRETNLADGRLITDSRFPDRESDEVNGRIGVRVNSSEHLAFRGAIYTGFRVPTLNELYRPFRVGNDVTEANPGLRPEHLLGGEAGADWLASENLRFTATAFLNRLEDAVGNVTLGYGPGTFNPGGFIPSGGVLRQRQNIDVVSAPGLEASVSWQVFPKASLRASYLWTHPSVERASDRALEGKLLAQTPENTLSAAADYAPAARWTLTAQVRYSDRQFENDQNLRVLAPYTSVDAGASYEISVRVSAAVRIENLFDTEIQTGKSATRVVSIGAPRLVSVRMRWEL